MKIFCTAVIVVMLGSAVANAATVKIHLLPSQSASKIAVPAGEPVIDVYRLDQLQDGQAPVKTATFSATQSSIATGTLAKGKYVLVSRTYNIDGDINTDFSASFLVGAAILDVGVSDASLDVPVIKFSLSHCKITPTQIFSQAYREKEAKAEAHGFKFEGTSAGRIIHLGPGDHGACAMNAEFPKQSIGPSSIHTYTPTAFEIYDDSSLRFASFVYNGRTENQHDLYMHQASLTSDGKKQISIDSVQEKTGVNIPWEPRMIIQSGGCSLLVASRIDFRSSESSKPATLGMTYIYFDDPFLPFNKNAMMLSSCD